MNEEKRALGWREFAESDFDRSAYSFPEEDCIVEATIAAKHWGKSRNLMVYLDVADGRRLATSVWFNVHYLGLAEVPVGSEIRAEFVRNKNGRLYLRSVELI